MTQALWDRTVWFGFSASHRIAQEHHRVVDCLGTRVSSLVQFKSANALFAVGLDQHGYSLQCDVSRAARSGELPSGQQVICMRNRAKRLKNISLRGYLE